MNKKILGVLIFVMGHTHLVFAETACFEVNGMTCATCTLTVKTAVKKIKGVTQVKATLEDKSAIVDFDPQKTSLVDIKKAIDNAGYGAVSKKCKENKG